MRAAVVPAILVGGALALAGLPLAYAVTRRLLLAMALGPLAAALLATVSIMAMLVVGGSLWPWLAVVFTLQLVVAFGLLRRRIEPVEHGTTADTGWLTVPLLPPMALALAPPTAWDAHSIWWLHAGYFIKGAATARQAMSEPALAFSHPDYPPLPSAPVAAVWQVLGAVDFRAAHTVSAVITLSAIVMLAFAVRRVLGQAPAALARSAGVLVALAAWATDPLSVTAGYSDALWATAFVAGALPLLLGRTARPLDLGLLAVAALSKNEGFIAVVVLAVLLSVRSPRRQKLWRPWVPVATGVSWIVLSRFIGASSDLQSGANVKAFLTLDPTVWRRLPPTLEALWSVAGSVVAIALVVALLGALVLRHQRRGLQLGSDLWLWCLAAAYALILALAYLMSPHDIAWHLATSAPRVGLPLVLIACASCAIWATVALCHTSTKGRVPAGADGTAPPAQASRAGLRVAGPAGAIPGQRASCPDQIRY